MRLQNTTNFIQFISDAQEIQSVQVQVKPQALGFNNNLKVERE
jgi:hypothetical protein